MGSEPMECRRHRRRASSLRVRKSLPGNGAAPRGAWEGSENMIDTARTAMTRSRVSTKASSFTESVIREMTRLAQRHGAVNLSQGFPDFAAPDVLKRAACDAVNADVNQYAITWGAKPLRD